MVERGVNGNYNREAGHECQPAPIAATGPRASSRPSRRSPSSRRGGRRYRGHARAITPPARRRGVADSRCSRRARSQRRRRIRARRRPRGSRPDAGQQDCGDKARLERLLGDRRDVSREHRQVHAGRVNQPGLDGQADGCAASAPAAIAVRTEADPHQFEAVHQLQEREHQQHRQERDDDRWHRRIFERNHGFASRRVAVLERDARRPTESVMSRYRQHGRTGSRTGLPSAHRGCVVRVSLSRLVERPGDEQRRPQPGRVETRRAERGGTATAAGSIRPSTWRSSGRRSRSARRPESCRTRGSASRRRGRRSCCRTRRRRSWRTAASRSRGENRPALRNQIDEWPSGSATPRSYVAVRASGTASPSTTSALDRRPTTLRPSRRPHSRATCGRR